VATSRAKQTRDTVAFVIVSAALQLSGPHGQHWLRAAECLNLRLFIDTEHQGMMGRIQIQANDVPHLVNQHRVAGELEALRAMRLQAKGPPDAADGGLAKAGSSSQHAAGPVRGALRRLLQSQPHDLLDLLVTDLARRSRTRFVTQSGNALGDEPVPPQPVVRSFAATAGLLTPPTHSRMIRARKATDRLLRDCLVRPSSSALWALRTSSSCFFDRPRRGSMPHLRSPVSYMQDTYDSGDYAAVSSFIGAEGAP
jgi:hypothetical protein